MTRACALILLACAVAGREAPGSVAGLKARYAKDPFGLVDALNASWAHIDGLGVDAALETADALADALNIVKLHADALSVRQKALDLRLRNGKPPHAMMLTYVALVDTAVLAQRYDEARRYLKKVKQMQVSRQEPAATALKRVESSLSDCVGDVASGVDAYAGSLGLSAGPAGLVGHPLRLTTDADVTAYLGYVKLLWRRRAELDDEQAVAAVVAAGDVRTRVRRALVTAANVDAELRAASALLLATGKWADAMQLPRSWTPGLTSRPWHAVAPAAGGGGGAGSYAGYPHLRPVQQALRHAHANLTAEFRRLQSSGLLLSETECIHSAPASNWTYFTVNGHWLRHRDEDGCSVATPVACDLMRSIAALGVPRLQILRAGYSAVGGRAYLRPHFGVTNGQLKFHLGLVTPTHPDGRPCAHLTVGNETHAWQAGKTLFFDDSWLHSVRNECDSERVVFQLVIRHPDAAEPGSGAGGVGHRHDTQQKKAPLFGSCSGH